MDIDFLLTADYSTTPIVGKMKLDTATNVILLYMNWAEIKLCRE